MTENQGTQETSAIVESGIGVLPYLVVRITGYSAANPSSISFGTGFQYKFHFDDATLPVIVTNKHVIKGFDHLSFHFGLVGADGRRILGTPEVVTIEVAKHIILMHPSPDVDLAIIPAARLLEEIMERGKDPFKMYLDKTNLPPAWLRQKLIASTEVLMVGFPNGLFDEVNNLPLLRKGILSTPYMADYKGKPNFVIDIAAFEGSSGSPVFSYFDGLAPIEDGGMAIGASDVKLIGVLHSGPVMQRERVVVAADFPSVKQVSVTGMTIHLGYCVKAELIEDFVPILEPLLPTP